MTTIFLNNTYKSIKSIVCAFALFLSLIASHALSAATLGAGGYHTCVVKNDGSLACWGINDDGRATPPIGIFSQLSVGWDHACAVRTDATLICWGRNESNLPVPVVGSFLQVSAGNDYTCALKTDGTLACWGDNLMTPPVGTFTQISTGWYHACGVKTDGTLACWGKNDYQQATPPEGTFLQVTANGYHSCGIKTDSTVVCWGNTSRNQASPPSDAVTQIAAGFWYTCGIKTDGTLACWGENDYGQALPPTGNFVQVTAGLQHACGVKTDGTVSCWGDNSKGQAAPPFEVTFNCSYHIEPPSYFHAASAATGTVTVFTSAAECPWTASSQVDWVTITAGNAGQGNGVLTYDVAANGGEQNREGTLFIADQSFAVSQWTTATTPVDTQNAFSMPVTAEAIRTESQNLSVQTPPKEFRSQTFPITLPNNIYGLSITGQFGLRLEAMEDDPAAFVRVVLVDNNTQSEYLVYEKSLQSLTAEEFNSPRPLKIEKVCEETCVLPQPLNSFSLRLEVRHGALSIGEVSYVETPIAEDIEELRAKQNAVKIWQLNEQDLGWIAGETSVSNLSYAEKKKLVGVLQEGQTEIREVNLQGFEYYRGGVFELKPTPATIRKRSNRASGLVDSFDWRNRHGENWITPVKHQKSCGSCWAFASAGAMETVTNLYFNQLLNLDLAEQDILSCSGAGTCGGGNPFASKIFTSGVVDEQSFPYQASKLPCGQKLAAANEKISTTGLSNTVTAKEEEKIKKLLMEKGPLVSAIGTLSHAITLVGFETDPKDGRTIWIFKNSWGNLWGALQNIVDQETGKIYHWGEYQSQGKHENGFAYIKLEPYNLMVAALENPVNSLLKPRQIVCEDNDGDGYCNWGISKDKPSTCPASCKPEKDCDDSNPDLAVFDANYNCTGKSQPQPPIAMFTANPLKGVMPLQVTFDASGSRDPDGTIAIYEWTIDGQPAGIGNPFIYAFDKPGQFEVGLTVTDQQGLTATFKKMVTVVGQYPPVAKFSISPNYVGNAPLTVGLNAKDSYDLDGKIVRYQWQSSAGHTSSDKNVQMTFNTAGSYTITLTVTDDSNLTGQAQREVIVTVNDVPAPTDCSQVTQIPPQECQALLALYHSTNGPNWKKKDNWNKTNMPCNWYGVGCKKGHVGTLYLTDNNLVGTLSPELNVLSAVTIFWFKLCGNQLSGHLPDLSALSVEWFCLNNNQLSGHITTQLPKSIGNLSLDNNQFTGPLPESIGNVFAMLSFSNNHFCGEVPRSVMKRTFRPEIGLSNNHLIASDPEVAAFLDRTMPGWEKTQTPGGDCAVSNCTYTITPTTTSHSLLPETGTLTITAPANCPWTATSNDGWIRITSGNSGQGNGTITYSVAGNTEFVMISPYIPSKNRNGTLTIAEQTVTINQKGEADCTYTITPTTASHSANSETGTLTITAPTGCNWYASSNDRWISITSKDRGQGNGTLTYSVTDNTNAGCISPCPPSQSRSGTISIAGQTVTVTQNAIMDLTNGLVAYYPFNGNANDESGNGNSGTVDGATLTEDRFGNLNSAYSFDGVNDKIYFTQKHFARNNQLSVSVWLKANPDNKNLYFAMCSDFGMWNSGIEAGLAISLPGTDSASGTLTGFGEWNHLVGTYDGTYIQTYINGNLIEKTLHEGTLSDPNRSLTFGVFSLTDPHYWAGVLDDIRIYNRVLSETEVRTLFNDNVTFSNSTPPKVEVANPIVSQAIYQTGETLRVTLPSLPVGQEQYVGIGLPNSSLYLLNQLNSFIPFDNVTFPVWPGGEVAIDQPVTADLPSGLYTVYLLRTPTGVSPSSVKKEDWALGTAMFNINHTACTYTVTPANISHSTKSETGTVTINAPAGCPWTATSNTQSITITSENSGQGNGTVTYSVKSNFSECVSPSCLPSQNRSGTLTIAGQMVTVNQQGER